ncbi:unnamed protein product [Orchesella dallaii]|uniref:Uncharacterized protein n=1 Tax=Orchesella dallaii TaxID=48710 RepID=A0ABP1RQ99_9HEXA
MLNPTNFTQDPSDLIEIRVQNQVQGRPKSDKRCTMTFGMHAAAKKGKVEELKSLLEKGDPWQRDDKNRTPLHYACEYGQQAVAYKMAKVILNCRQVAKATNKTKRKLVDCQDPAGDTALHIAARIGHPDVVDLLLCEGADVDIKNRKDEKQLELIYKTVPSTMTAEYDYSVSCKKGDLIDNDQNLTLDIDFGAICGIPNPKPGPDSDSPLKFHPETKWLYDCLGLSLKKQQVILMHPVVQLFLHLKWKKIRILLWLSILYHIFWLILYTAFNVNLYSFSCPYHNRSSTRHTVTATPFTKSTN